MIVPAMLKFRSQAVVPAMMRRRSGKIVVVGSITAALASPFNGAYAVCFQGLKILNSYLVNLWLTVQVGQQR